MEIIYNMATSKAQTQQRNKTTVMFMTRYTNKYIMTYMTSGVLKVGSTYLKSQNHDMNFIKRCLLISILNPTDIPPLIY